MYICMYIRIYVIWNIYMLMCKYIYIYIYLDTHGCIYGFSHGMRPPARPMGPKMEAEPWPMTIGPRAWGSLGQGPAAIFGHIGLAQGPWPMRESIDILVHRFLCIYIYISLYVYPYIYIYMAMYIYIHIFIYLYIYIYISELIFIDP